MSQRHASFTSGFKANVKPKARSLGASVLGAVSSRITKRTPFVRGRYRPTGGVYHGLKEVAK